MPESRVVKIKTLSVLKEEEKPRSPVKPKQPKHWYFLWLAEFRHSVAGNAAWKPKDAKVADMNFWN